MATLGAKVPVKLNRAWEVIEDAHSRDIKVSGLVSFHMGPSIFVNEPSISHFSGRMNNRIIADHRSPAPFGSHHQKLFCIRDTRESQNPGQSHVYLGSLDLTRSRWDRPAHLAKDDDREMPGGLEAKSTHDVGFRIKGPAIADLEATFLERWNDPSYVYVDRQDIKPRRAAYKINSNLTNQPAQGIHSVQVLRTFGRITDPKRFRYTWSGTGEFTIWASYLNAIEKASNYIYIEDQYFIPFGNPPYYKQSKPSKTRDSDLFYQLGQALKRGVRVLAVVPHKSEDPLVSPSQNYQRAIGIKFLRDQLNSTISQNLIVACLTTRDSSNNESPIFIHSKLMIVDDEFAIVGTPNFNRRSMTHDSEIAVGVVDAQNAFAKDLRKKLWAEHLEVLESDIDDVETGYNLFKAAVSSASGQGRVRKYDETIQSQPSLHNYLINKLIDPYSGPNR